jgi:hypothetical protein
VKVNKKTKNSEGEVTEAIGYIHMRKRRKDF